MKLLQCLDCSDIRALSYDEVQCECGKSKGHYKDKIWAEYSGPARLLGLKNIDLMWSKLEKEHLSLAERGIAPGTFNPEYVWWVIPEGEHCTKVDT